MSGKWQRGLSQELLKENRNFVPETVPDAVFFICTNMKGVLIWFDVRKGFGFITDEDNIDYFVHYSEIHGDGFKRLKEGQKVNFEPGEDDRKRSVALSVTVEEQE